MISGGGGTRGFSIRQADADDLMDVLGVLDGGNLETDAAECHAAIERGEVFVATSQDATVIGALVLDGDELTHVAVRRRRRGQGIGTALVCAAVDRLAGEPVVSKEADTEEIDAEELTARFDPGARPFYEALGFAIEPVDSGRRYVGRLPLDEGFDDIVPGRE